jgi:5-methylcytosine-specific restriction endonuclease McrA
MKCVKCGQIEKKPYKVKTGKRKGKIQSYCRKCNHQNTLDRQRDFKKQCVDYKGGKCVFCGYDKYIGSLDFHHLDPAKKDFGLSKVKNTSFNKNQDKIKKELDKCILVCRNCHGEIHANIIVYNED